MVRIWYKETEWTRGEWGVDPKIPYLFDDSWSRWTALEVNVIHVIREWGIARVAWVDNHTLNAMARKVKREE